MNDKRDDPGLDRFTELKTMTLPVTGEFDMSAEEIAAILEKRAKTLARVPDADKGRSETLQYITFSLSDEDYAVEVGYVQEIQPLRDLTLIPCTPDFIVGAVNIRGQIISLVDLKKFFGIPSGQSKDQAKVVVTRTDDREIGLLADRVSEVMSLPVDAIDQPLATLAGVREEYIKGVAKGGLIILDIAAILSDKRMVINEEVV